MILVCGGLADTVTELVCARLQNCGYPYRFLDLGTYPKGFKIKWSWQGPIPNGYIAGPDWKVDLNELTGVYARYLGPEGRLPPPDTPTSAAPAIYNEYDTGLITLMEDLPCVVINRIAGGLSNNSKLFQALLVRQSGLRTPPTLVTNDAEAVVRFYHKHHENIIYKSLSGVRSIVRRLSPDQLDRLPLLCHCPTQFQACIPGINVRVHTVGDELFAVRVHSDVVDYRYAHAEGSDVTMEPVSVPPSVANSCLQLSHQLGLLLSGIDLKETPEGDYYCFEINPSPGFLYYEKYSGQPISLAVAELLHNGMHSSGLCSKRNSHTQAAMEPNTTKVNY